MLRQNSDFDFALKGHGFSRAVQTDTNAGFSP
jgi:hypothetical protein